MLTKSLTDEEIIREFGDFSPYLNHEGIPSVGWEQSILQFITLPAPLPLAWNKEIKVYRIQCHKRIASQLKAALLSIYDYPSSWETINDYGGCYNFRLQRKSRSSLSKHCWAIAIDLDVGDNPFGKDPKVDPLVRNIFEEHGFIWGGIFPKKRVDGMHFEFVDIQKLS